MSRRFAAESNALLKRRHYRNRHFKQQSDQGLKRATNSRGLPGVRAPRVPQGVFAVIAAGFDQNNLHRMTRENLLVRQQIPEDAGMQRSDGSVPCSAKPG
jgi:hypothetical protein